MNGRLLEGRYRIGPRIARGGMASVYEATDIRLDRTVAVKVMHPGLGDDDEFAARFVREARAAARLTHPNVVGVYDQGDEDGTVFLVMELVSGHTMRDLVRKEAPLTPARALALLDPVLSALAAAHRAGLIHRDVKPENVLIADDGRVKVADFGLAKAVSADTQHTATGGVLIGTVSYLAPELVVDGRADARADVYAAGVLLYELLTGLKPHEGESPIQVAYKHVHEDVPPPSSVVPGIPSYVDALVARATSRDRGQRPADAGVLLHQVHRVSQALAEGLHDDAELTQDLTPTQAVALLPRPEVEAEDTDELPSWLHDSRLSQDTHPILRAAARQPAEPPAARPPSRPAAPPPARPRRSRRGPLLMVLALLLAVGVGVGAWWFGFARWTQTPSVLGLTQAQAVQKLEAAGLGVDIGDPAYSETVPKGQVLATDPGAGERVLKDGTVTLSISLGKERYDVPKLRGLTEDQAQDKILGTHLTFGQSIKRWSDTVPAGQVLRSDPPPGTRVKRGAVVDLYLSRGPKPVEVRDWTGKDATAAAAWFDKRGITVDDSQQEYSDSVPEGHVVRQDPTSGTLYRGDTVRLVVSQGPELIEVPHGLVASGVEDATQRLEALGFRVRVEHDASYIGLGYVFNTTPDAGEMVPRGSTITLYLI
ncbi:MAG TPA: Stk1 family PASTA domain-containing Ser/Thr kinase [Nocardioides sp.]|nr:Stk1 family PASTA domain-containing Ser/Thr kinase [Nocardioides sp.]